MRVGIGTLGIGLLALAACWPAPRPRPPNVLVLVWDTVRADHLSLYGHRAPTTPRLDALAASAVVFEQARSPAMWTVPSHASLFTGLPVGSHGADVGWIWLDDHHTTAAEWFGAHGWDTWAFSANPYVSEATHLLQGFDEVVTSWEGPWADAAHAATTAKLIPEDASVEISPRWHGEGPGWPSHLTRAKDAGDVAATAFDAWLDARSGDRPFFAFVNYLEAHHPRIPTLASRQAVMGPSELAHGLEMEAGLLRLMGAMEGRVTLSDADHVALRATYDAAIRDLDAATGRLLDRLAARGQLDDTIVVVVADHGEHLGERGRYDHRWSVDEPLLHVPLVIRYPARLAPGRRTDLVSTASLLSTLCGLSDLPRPAGLGAADLRTVGEGAVFAEMPRPSPRLSFVLDRWPDLDPDRWRNRYQVAWHGREKVVRASDGHLALFDLGADPGETVDLAATQPDRAVAGRAALDAWLRERPRYDPARRGPGDHPRPALADDDPLREQLRSLGYQGDP